MHLTAICVCNTVYVHTSQWAVTGLNSCTYHSDSAHHSKQDLQERHAPQSVHFAYNSRQDRVVSYT